MIGLVGARESRPAAPPSFRGTIARVDPAGLTSWHRGCPVPVAALRLLRMSYWSFDGEVGEGELIVHRRWARPVLGVFAKLFAAHFPIRRMRLVEAYGSDDDRVGYADDTSGFNCRFVKGTRSWSEHAYGRAIDVNPRENPFVAGDRVSPPAGRKFLNRHRWRPGMIHTRDRVVRAFAAIGWRWGGYWGYPRDYMHFSSTGR